MNIPDKADADVRVGRRAVHLTNLTKSFWPGIAKRDLLQYYSDVADALIPHVKDRPMVMKRYPNGYRGEFFFMKRAPAERPEWIRICSVKHGSGSSIDFPIVRDLPSLLWMINLGCIDLNPWYSQCDDIYRPDFLHFDLDPVTPQPLMSMTRCEVGLFPLFMWAGWWASRRRLTAPIVGAMAVLLGLFTVEFVTWRLVA